MAGLFDDLIPEAATAPVPDVLGGGGGTVATVPAPPPETPTPKVLGGTRSVIPTPKPPSPAPGTPQWITDKITAHDESATEPPAALLSLVPGADTTRNWRSAQAWAEEEAVKRYANQPRLLDATIKAIRLQAQIEEAKELDATGASAAAERARKRASEKVENEIMQNIYGPKPSINRMHILQMEEQGLIDRESRGRLFTQLNEIEKGEGESELKRIGKGFWDAYNRIHAIDPSDPNFERRITDATELYKLAGPNEPDETKRVTHAGIQILLDELYKPKKPETHDEDYRIKEHLEGAKRQLTGGIAGMPGYKDPQGEELFERYMGGFFERYRAAREDKTRPKTVDQLLNPESPDFIGKALHVDTAHGGYARTMQQILKSIQEQRGGLGEEAPAVPAAPTETVYPGQVRTPPPPAKVYKTPQEVKADYDARKIDYWTASDILIKNNWKLPTPAPAKPAPQPAPPPPPQVPTR